MWFGVSSVSFDPMWPANGIITVLIFIKISSNSSVHVVHYPKDTHTHTYRYAQNSWDVQSSIDLFSCADDVDAAVLGFVADESSTKTTVPKCHRCLPFPLISCTSIQLPNYSWHRIFIRKYRVRLEWKEEDKKTVAISIYGKLIDISMIYRCLIKLAVMLRCLVE